MQKPTGILEIKDLKCYFGGNRAVDGTTFEVAKNQITALIGPNGAGKTTTFNCVAGLIKPTAGQIYFNGIKITGLSADKIFNAHRLHRTFQIPMPFGSMTVLENLMTPFRKQFGEHAHNFLRPAKISRQEQAFYDLAIQKLKLVGLERQFATPADELSGGQRKLLEIARALIDEPLLLLLDEPTAGVNPTLAVEICRHLRKICDETELSMLLISHDMNSVHRLCERVIVMASGKVMFSGTAEEVTASHEVQRAYLGHAKQ